MTQKLRKGSKAYIEKNEAFCTKKNRKLSPTYDEDVRLYGKGVADFNAGFLVGWDDGHAQGKKAAKARKAA